VGRGVKILADEDRTPPDVLPWAPAFGAATAHAVLLNLVLLTVWVLFRRRRLGVHKVLVAESAWHPDPVLADPTIVR
jgi:hypothetical protein